MFVSPPWVAWLGTAAIESNPLGVWIPNEVGTLKRRRAQRKLPGSERTKMPGDHTRLVDRQ